MALEVIKVELPGGWLKKFRRYVAEKYGFRRGALSKALANIIEKELRTEWSPSSDNVDAIVGLGLLSDYEWWGEDLIEALRKKYSSSDRR